MLLSSVASDLRETARRGGLQPSDLQRRKETEAGHGCCVAGRSRERPAVAAPSHGVLGARVQRPTEGEESPPLSEEERNEVAPGGSGTLGSWEVGDGWVGGSAWSWFSWRDMNPCPS